MEQLADQREFDRIFDLIKTSESMGMLSEKGRDHLLLQVVKKLIAQGQVYILFVSLIGMAEPDRSRRFRSFTTFSSRF